MRRLVTVITVVAFLMVLGSSLAIAAPFVFGDGGVSLQAVLDGITTSPVFGDSSIDVTQDALPDNHDSTWHTTATGSSVATFIVSLSSYDQQNSFGAYATNSPMQKVQLFGPDSEPGDFAVLSVLDTGQVLVNGDETGISFPNGFGFYIDATEISYGGVWYSSTLLNADQYDHMAAYQGLGIDKVQLPGYAPGMWTDNEFILAFEETSYPMADLDYDDMVVMVESVTPSPEPGTLLLLGMGLFSLGCAVRKRTFA